MNLKTKITRWVAQKTAGYIVYIYITGNYLKKVKRSITYTIYPAKNCGHHLVDLTFTTHNT